MIRYVTFWWLFFICIYFFQRNNSEWRWFLNHHHLLLWNYNIGGVWRHHSNVQVSGGANLNIYESAAVTPSLNSHHLLSLLVISIFMETLSLHMQLSSMSVSGGNLYYNNNDDNSIRCLLFFHLRHRRTTDLWWKISDIYFQIRVWLLIMHASTKRLPSPIIEANDLIVVVGGETFVNKQRMDQSFKSFPSWKLCICWKN